MSNHAITTLEPALITELEVVQRNPADLLADPILMRQLAVTYRHIYGYGELRKGKMIWGEGARDPGNLGIYITLEEYYQRLADDDLTAPSGQLFQLMYTDEKLFEKFRKELTTHPDQIPYAAYVKATEPDGENRVVGLTWGGLVSLDLVRADLMNEVVPTGELSLAELDMVLARTGLTSSDPVLYVRELVMEQEYRRGGRYTAQLIALAFHHGQAHGQTRLFFWTSSNSLMSYIGQAVGAHLLYEANGCQYFFVDSATVNSLLDEIRQSSPEQVLRHKLLRFARSKRIVD